MGKSGKAAAVVGLSALVGGVGLFSSPVFGDVGDDIGIRVGTATADFDGSALTVVPTGFKSCDGTVIDPNGSGSFRLVVPADCLDGYLVSGAGYGGLGAVDVVIDSPFEADAGPGDVRDLAPNSDLTDPAYSRQDGNVNVFDAAAYPCADVILEAASIGGVFSGRPTTCGTFASTVPITFTASQALGCDEESGGIDVVACPGGGPDDDGLGEYRINLTFEDGTTVRIGGDRDSDGDSGSPNDESYGDFDSGRFFSTTQLVDVLGPKTLIHVELVDEDDGSGSNDDLVDINPADNATSIDILFDTETGSWMWPEANDANQHWARGDGDTEHLSNGGHPTILVFDLSAFEPDPDAKDSRSGDRDGDGLLDGWELWGLEIPDVDHPHPVTSPNPPLFTVIDPAWGTSPHTADLFVENDWVAGGKPLTSTSSALTYLDMYDVFQNSSRNIDLRVDTGPIAAALTPGSVPVGDSRDTTAGDDLRVTAVNPDGTSVFAGGNEIDIAALGLDQVCGTNLGHQSDQRAIKIENFNPNRRWVFRYAISADDATFTTTNGCVGGQAEIGGNDMVELNRNAGTFMHEFGHNLGLLHGGGSQASSDNRNKNCKPNYLSVMNYRYQNKGLLTGSDPGDPRLLGYSDGSRPVILEGQDDEGMFAPAETTFFFEYYDGTTARAIAGDDPGDWNGNKVPGETFVGPFPLLDFRASGCADDIDTAPRALDDHDDWEFVTLTIRDSDFYDDGAVDVSDVDIDMPTNADQLAHDIEFFSGRDLSVVGVAPGSVEVGAPFEVVFTPTTLDQSRDVEIELTLPAGVSSTGAGDCAAGSGLIVCQLPALPGGKVLYSPEHPEVKAELVVDADGPLGSGDSFELSAFISDGAIRSVGGFTFDLASEDGPVTVAIEDTPADNTITLTINIE